MSDRTERRRLLVAWGIVVGAAIAHRLILYLIHRSDLEAFIADNQVWYILQYLPPEMMRDHLFRAMLLLQQTPPVPNLLVGLALKGFSWPSGVAQVLIRLQSLTSILTAAVFVHLLSVLYPRRVVLWIALGLLFVLSTDLIVLEHLRIALDETDAPPVHQHHAARSPVASPEHEDEAANEGGDAHPVACARIGLRHEEVASVVPETAKPSSDASIR